MHYSSSEDESSLDKFKEAAVSFEAINFESNLNFKENDKNFFDKIATASKRNTLSENSNEENDSRFKVTQEFKDFVFRKLNATLEKY
jgi:hypothetical protein